ncbi:MAG: hypothetical protein ACREKI_08385 [Gemmatimonadota bacterium]
MRRSVWMGAIAVLALLGTSSMAAAQACRGTAPIGRAAASDYGFEGALVFPEEGTGFYGAFKWAPSLNLALDFSGEYISDITPGGGDLWVLGGTGAYRFFQGSPREFPFDICLHTGVLPFFGADGIDANGFVIPIGASFGNDFSLGQSSVRIAPYFNPNLAIQRVSNGASDTETLFYMDLGASFLFSQGWYAGLSLIFGDGDRATGGDTEIRIRGGKILGRTAAPRRR